jgi:hypothetical protein
VAYCECLKIWEKAGGTVVLYLVCGVVAIIVMTKSMDFKKILKELEEAISKDARGTLIISIIVYAICFGLVILLREHIMNATQGIFDVHYMVKHYLKENHRFWLYEWFCSVIYTELFTGLLNVLFECFIVFFIPITMAKYLYKVADNINQKTKTGKENKLKKIFIIINVITYFLLLPLLVFNSCDFLTIRNNYGIYFRWTDMLIIYFSEVIFAKIYGICKKELQDFYWSSIILNYVAFAICFLIAIYGKNKIMGMFEYIHQVCLEKGCPLGMIHLFGVIFCLMVMYVLPALIIKICTWWKMEVHIEREAKLVEEQKRIAEEQKRLQEEERKRRIAQEKEQKRIAEEQRKKEREEAERQRKIEAEKARQDAYKKAIDESKEFKNKTALFIVGFGKGIEILEEETTKVRENPIYLKSDSQLELLKKVKVCLKEQEFYSVMARVKQKSGELAYKISQILEKNLEDYATEMCEKEKKNEMTEEEKECWGGLKMIYLLEGYYNMLLSQWKELAKQYEQEYNALRLGKEGEEKVNNYLSKYASSLFFKSNVCLQYQNEKCEIDDIIIAPQGVFSVEVKNIGSTGKYSVEIDNTGRWQKILSNGEKITMDYNAKRQNDMHQRIVEEIVNEALHRNIENRIFVQGIVIIANDEIDFVNHSKQKIYRVDGLIDEIRSYPPNCLNTKEMEQVIKALEAHEIEAAKYPMIDYKTLFDKINTFYAEIIEIGENMEI